MNKDDSLLKLEKKLEEHDEKEIILNKFKLKPNMKMDNSRKINKEGLMDFLNKFKKSNDEIDKDNDKKKYNIELDENDNINEDYDNEKNKYKKEKESQIELDLLLGIIEQKKEKKLQPKDIINLNNIEEGTDEIINFINKKKEKDK